MDKDIKLQLKELYWVNKSIDTLKDEIEYNECLLTRVTPTLKSDIVQNSNRLTIEDLIIKRDRLQEKLSNKVHKQIEIKNKIEKLIDCIEDIRLQDLIRRRYLRNQKWVYIANELNYSLDGVYKAHGRALRLMRKYNKK